MPKYKLTIAYDGTHYSGWQVQTNAISIQSLVQKSLETALRSPIALTGSGRTDSGVHALCQVAHFSFPAPIDPFRLRASLNGLLPEDIRILEIEEAPEDFHARYSAVGKTYHYYIQIDGPLNPFRRLYSYKVFHPVDLALLKEAARLFIGTHDFSSFAHEADKGSASRDPVRTLTRLDVIEEAHGFRLEFEGNGFLHKMVRNITGTLLDISYGKISLDEIPAIFAAKDRSKAGRTAPPHGLFLAKVHFPCLLPCLPGSL